MNGIGYPRLPLAAEPMWSYVYSNFGEGDHLVRCFTHRNYSIGMHTHDFPEINIVTRGRGLHYIGEMMIEVRVGDVFVMPPEVMHGYFNLEELDVMHILASPGFMQRYHSELYAMPGFAKMFAIEPYLRQVYDENLFLRLSEAEMTVIAGELEELERLEQAENYMCETIFALALICRFCMRMDSSMREQPHNAVSSEILAVMEHIRLHPDEKLTLPYLAGIAHMSRSTFCRQFEKIVCMPPGEYIRRCRVEYAERLLSEGKMSRTDVAQACGFYDVSHMNRVLQGK